VLLLTGMAMFCLDADRTINTMMKRCADIFARRERRGHLLPLACR